MSTASKPQRLWNAVATFNKRHENFGTEYCNDNFKFGEQVLKYKIVLFQNIRCATDCGSESDWMKSDDIFYMQTMSFLRKLDPDVEWAIIEVTGDGNCFFHGGGANQIVMEPGRTDVHFYHQLRHKICDKLEDFLDSGRSGLTADKSFLHFYQLQCAGDYRVGERPPNEVFLPIADEDMPPQAADQSDEDYQIVVRNYRAQCKLNIPVVRQFCLEHIQTSRTHGTVNTEQHALGLALLTGKRVKLLSFRDGVVLERQEFRPNGCTDDSPFIPLIQDSRCREGGCDDDDDEHWITAVPLDSFENYAVSEDTPPKSRQTHDRHGVLRTSQNPCPRPQHCSSHAWNAISGYAADSQKINKRAEKASENNTVTNHAAAKDLLETASRNAYSSELKRNAVIIRRPVKGSIAVTGRAAKTLALQKIHAQAGRKPVGASSSSRAVVAVQKNKKKTGPKTKPKSQHDAMKITRKLTTDVHTALTKLRKTVSNATITTRKAVQKLIQVATKELKVVCGVKRKFGVK